MQIERLVRRTAVGGLIVAGGVVAAQSAAAADEASTDAAAAPVKRQLLDKAAPATKATTAPATSKTAKATKTTKKAAASKRRQATTVKTATPTSPATTAPALAPAVVVAEPATTTVAAPAEQTAAVQTAVVLEEPAPAPAPAPVPQDPAPEIVLTWPTSTQAAAGDEVGADQPVATGPPPPTDSGTTVANTALVSTEPNVQTADVTGTSPNGQITITIDEPAPGTVVAPGTPVVVTGTVTVGGPTAINVIYVIDVSGSTSSTGGACGDTNGDGDADTILDCEIAGIIALNNSLGNANIDVSIVAFDDSAATADVGPAPGVQTTTGPATDADGNGSPDIVDVLTTLTPSGGTDFDAALAQVQTLLVPGEQNIVFFLSDGQSSLATGPGSPLQAVADAGATVLTFAVGSGTSGCAAGEPLSDIAATTGGTCTEVTDPTQLSAALTGFNLAGIDRVEIEVNGFVGQATLSPLGFFTITIPADLLLPGQNTIIARAFGAGDQAGQVATADTFVVVGSPVKVAGAGGDLVDLHFDLDDLRPALAGSLPVTGIKATHMATTGALSFLLGGLLLGGAQHLRRRRRRPAHLSR